MPKNPPDDDLLQAGLESGVPIDAVDITNDFMFAYVMRDPSLCRELLEYLLPGRKIHQIRYLSEDGTETVESAQPEPQKSLAGAFDKRGVRLDVYLDDGKSIFNVELQVAPEKAIAQRARLYQAHIDIHQLDRGQNFDELKPSFVIFICKFDPFGKGLYRYEFENICRDADGLALNDETYKLFFNTKGIKGDISENLRSLLEYMNDTKAYPVGETSCDLIKKIEQAVGMARQNDDWRRAFVTYQIYQRQAELRGEERGIAIGEKRGIAIGEERGEQRAKREIAKQMLSNNLPVELIARISGLSVSEITALQG